jgi:hypothetical protein
VGLARQADTVADDLSYGEQRCWPLREFWHRTRNSSFSTSRLRD